MKNTIEEDTHLVQYTELFQLGTEILTSLGVSVADAEMTIRILLDADLRGIDTHGIQRLLMYVPRLRKGLINPTPNITTHDLSPVIRHVDGDHGLGQVVAARGMIEAIELAKEWGIGFVTCEKSNHFGAAASFVAMACDERLIGLAGTNAFPTMAPWGGLKNMVGNNPFGVGVPCEGEPNFILDIALSVSSRGRIRQMLQSRKSIPAGWALDSSGAITQDPLEALKGFVLPIGNHKGYGIALAIDILTGVLSGAGFANGVKSMLQQWDAPQDVGHSMLVIDPTRFMSWEEFAARMTMLRALMRSVPLINPDQPVMFPGEPEARNERERRRNGIPIPSRAMDALQGLKEGKYDYAMPQF